MKTIKNLFLFTLICLIFINCSSKNEDEEPLIIEPSATQIGIDIDGLNGIDYTGTVAISPDNEETINNNGVFEDPYTDNGIEDLPVLIVKDGALFFGYFPQTIDANKVKIDDILLFYFLIYPEIAVQGVDYQSILNEIKSSKDYIQMKSLIINDLNQNKSPGDNQELTALVRNFSQDFVESISSKKTKVKGGEIEGEFKFTYTRNGEIKWLDEVPLYAAVGLSIKNDITGDVVLSPTILKTKSLVLSPTSIIAWTFSKIYNDNDPKTSSFIMPDFGTYTVSFSNGHGISKGDLNERVRAKNVLYIGANLIGYAIPISLKLIKIDPNCANSIQQLKDEAYVKANQFLLKGDVPSSAEVLKVLLDLSTNIVDIYSECLGKANAKLFVKLLAGAIAKKLQLLEDIATLSLLLRDFLGSDISGRETRHFSNEVSFGELKVVEPYTSFDLEGFPEDKFEYNKTIHEKVISYDVDRGVLSSSFTLKEEWLGAINLPFNVDVVSGNSRIESINTGNENPIYVNPEGILPFTIVAGDEDSQITVSPVFESIFIDDETINLQIAPEYRPFSLSTTNIDFGDVKINKTGTEVLTITNNLDYDLNINSITGNPIGIYLSWTNGVIQANGSQDINITFGPTEIKTYSEELTIVTDFNDFLENKVQIKGNGIAETGELYLSGNLNFGNVQINSSVTKVLNINNPSSIPVLVTSIDLPNGYVAAWSSGTIQPSETYNVDITFTPTQVQDYSGTITVNNDADQENNTIAVSGTGSSDYGIYSDWIIGSWKPRDTYVENGELILTDYGDCIDLNRHIYNADGSYIVDVYDNNTSNSCVLQPKEPHYGGTWELDFSNTVPKLLLDLFYYDYDDNGNIIGSITYREDPSIYFIDSNTMRRNTTYFKRTN